MPTTKPRFVAILTDDQKAALETLRARLGLRSSAEVVRFLIDREMRKETSK